MKIFDAHSDIPTDIVNRKDKGEKNIFNNTYLNILRNGNVDGSIFVTWIEPKYSNDYRNRLHYNLVSISREILESVNIKIIKKFDDFKIAEEQGKFAVILGMEGLKGFDNDEDYLYYLYEYGIRHASLTWNEENNFATGILGDSNRGLTKEGIKTLKIMEKLGMIIDVSHLNEKSFWDVHNNTSKPYIASHSNAFTLCKHPRNLNNDQLKAIRDRNGVIGINAWSDFISEKNPTLSKLTDHVDYIVDLIGIDHVGFGFDFTSFFTSGLSFDSDKFIDELQDQSQTYNFIYSLKNRGYTKEEINKISWGNFMRVFMEILKN